MTIYNQIASNKTRTWLIFGIFIFIMTGIFYLIGQYSSDPGTYFFMGLAVSLASSLGSYFFSDRIVLASTGARPADKQKYFGLYTVTENLAIASGTPMPKIYVVDDPAPNAFATGRDPKHAVVCATTGLLSMMDRSELEGVIGHELSHVRNYDILLMTVVSVLVGTLALISDWTMRSFWWRGSRDSDDEGRSGRNPVLFIALILALILGPIVATLIQLAISRRREYLADASGALLTRNPDALASALAKISQYPGQLRQASSATAHLFIANPFKKGNASSWLTNLFSTHPPVDERIRILREM